MTMMLVIFSQAFLKLVYLDWRPVFLSAALDPSACEPDYGRPSGHALTMSILLPMVLLTVFSSRRLVSRIVCYSVSSVLVFLVCLSRLFYAKHSVNQLFLGAAMGLFLYVLLFHLLSDWLDSKFLKPLVTNGVTAKSEHKGEAGGRKDSGDSSAGSDQQILIKSGAKLQDASFRRVTRACGGLMLLSNLLLVVAVVWSKFITEFPDSNFFARFANCAKLKSMYHSEFSSKIVRDGGLFNIFFGLVLACQLNHRRLHRAFKSQSDRVSSFRNPFQALQLGYDGNLKNTCLRVLALLLCALPITVVLIVKDYLDGLGAVFFSVVMGLGMPLLAGVLMGSLYFTVLDCCGVPLYQNQVHQMVKLQIQNDQI